MSIKHQIPKNLNILLSTLFILSNIWILILLPWLVLEQNILLSLTLLPVVFFTTTFWSLIHESFHEVMHPSKNINSLFGRVMCVLFGAPFLILRFGHLLHHKVNRSDIDRSEVFKTNGRKKWFNSTLYYYNLTIGLYITELLSNFIILLPVKWIEKLLHRRLSKTSNYKNTFSKVKKQLLSGKRLWQNRIEGLLIIALMSSAFIGYGNDFWLFCLFLLFRGIAISYWDNAFHYGTEINNNKAAFNLYLPSWYARSILNFNYHKIHHHYPYLPWTKLPEAFKKNNEIFDGKYWPVSLHQLNGPIFLKD